MPIKRGCASGTGNGLDNKLVVKLADDFEGLGKLIASFVSVTRKHAGDTFMTRPRPLNNHHGEIVFEYPYEAMPKNLISRVGMDSWGSFHFAIEFNFKAQLYESEGIKPVTIVLKSEYHSSQLSKLIEERDLPIAVKREIVSLSKNWITTNLRDYDANTRRSIETSLAGIKNQMREMLEEAERVELSRKEMVDDLIETEKLLDRLTSAGVRESKK